MGELDESRQRLVFEIIGDMRFFITTCNESALLPGNQGQDFSCERRQNYRGRKKMYLHLGNEYSVKISDIVGIFDIENTTVDKATKGLLERAEKKKKMHLYNNGDAQKLYHISKNGG